MNAKRERPAGRKPPKSDDNRPNAERQRPRARRRSRRKKLEGAKELIRQGKAKAAAAAATVSGAGDIAKTQGCADDRKTEPTVSAPPAETGDGGQSSPAGQYGPNELKRSEMQLVEQAIRRRFPTEPVVMEALINRVAETGMTTTSERSIFRAAQVYMMAERMNQIDEIQTTKNNQLPRKHVHLHSVINPNADQSITPEGQRAALIGACIAERQRRGIDRRRSDEAGDQAGSGATGSEPASSDGAPVEQLPVVESTFIDRANDAPELYPVTEQLDPDDYLDPGAGSDGDGRGSDSGDEPSYAD